MINLKTIKMKRHATQTEQEAIDKANEILAKVGLVTTEAQDKDGAVIPTKGF